MIPKDYLGDGVYIEVENGMFKVTTEDGIRATNTIFLELEVYEALVRYADRAKAAAAAVAVEGIVAGMKKAAKASAKEGETSG